MQFYYGFLLGMILAALVSVLSDDIKRFIRKEVARALEQETPMPELKKAKVVA